MKRLNSTDKIELVETHNLQLSLTRLRDAAPYDGERWKRALYHAIGLTLTSFEEKKRIREALNLP